MKKSAGKFNLVLGLLFLILPVESYAENARQWLEKAITEPDIDRKIEYYNRALSIDPEDAKTHNNLGVLYKKKGLFKEAITHYEMALDVPGYETPEFAHNNLGVIYREMKEYKKAIEHFQAAVDFDPKFAKAYNGMGMAYKSLGEYEKAAECFRNAVEIQPDYVQAEYNLKNIWKLPVEEESSNKKIDKMYSEAVSAANHNNYPQALDLLQKALETEPDNVKLKQKLNEFQKHQEFEKYYNLAAKYKKEGDTVKTLENLEAAGKLAISKEETEKISNLQNSTTGAINLEKQEIRRASLYERGVRHLNNKEWLYAMSAFTKLMMKDPENEEIKQLTKQARVGYYHEEALNYVNQGKWKEAEETLINLIDIDPQNEKAHLLLNDVRDKIASRQIDYLLEKAQQAYNLGDWAQARRSYQEVLRLAPDNKTAKVNLEKIPQTDIVPGNNLANPLVALTNWFTPLMVVTVFIICLIVYYAVIRTLKTTHFINYYHRFKDGDESRILYERMLQEDPGRRPVYPLLAETYHELAQDAKIDVLIARCEEYSKQVPKLESADWILCLGEIFQSIHQLEKAAKFMEQALTMKPDEQIIKDKLAQVYQTMLKQHYTPQLAARLAQLQQPSSPVVSAAEEKRGDEKLTLLKECFARAKG
ncbi:MAG: tetratricopeptide repeat protein [Candidatus Schekmanbacteria bacterium]|nr:tetratricopeptide repeat protein [Candidatus Schekmanbacteria bacterium]